MFMFCLPAEFDYWREFALTGARSAQSIVDSALSNLRSMVNERLTGKTGGGGQSSGGGKKTVRSDLSLTTVMQYHVQHTHVFMMICSTDVNRDNSVQGNLVKGHIAILSPLMAANGFIRS